MSLLDSYTKVRCEGHRLPTTVTITKTWRSKGSQRVHSVQNNSRALCRRMQLQFPCCGHTWHGAREWGGGFDVQKTVSTVNPLVKGMLSARGSKEELVSCADHVIISKVHAPNRTSHAHRVRKQSGSAAHIRRHLVAVSFHVLTRRHRRCDSRIRAVHVCICGCDYCCSAVAVSSAASTVNAGAEQRFKCIRVEAAPHCSHDTECS